jgi:hypothetical protein
MAVEANAAPYPSGGTPKPRGTQLTGVPNVVEVRQPQWARHEFDERSALVIKRAEGEQLDFFVNMDNIYLKNEIVRRKSTERSLIEYYFKYGLSLLALGILHIRRESAGEIQEETAEEEETGWPSQEVKDEIAAACRGSAVTIIPIIIQLGKIPAKAGI